MTAFVQLALSVTSVSYIIVWIAYESRAPLSTPHGDLMDLLCRRLGNSNVSELLVRYHLVKCR